MITAGKVVAAVEQVVAERPDGCDWRGSVRDADGELGLAGQALLLLGQGLPPADSDLAGASVIQSAMRMLWPLTRDGLAALETVESEAGEPWLVVLSVLSSRYDEERI